MEVLAKSKEWNEKRLKGRWTEVSITFQASNWTVGSLSRGLDCQNLKPFTIIGRQKVTCQHGLLLESQEHDAKENAYFWFKPLGEIPCTDETMNSLNWMPSLLRELKGVCLVIMVQLIFYK